MSTAELAQTIKDLARRMGFLAAGIAPASPVAHAERLHAWLERGFCAGMDFMRRNLAKRLCPSELVEGARTVICLAVSYAPPPPDDRDGLVARYARGADYHDVLHRRCIALMGAIRAIEPSFIGRAFVDSAPVMERSLAAAAGLGWIGRNGCLFVEGAGSFCVLAEIVCNLPLPPDAPVNSRCGDCRQCLSACPTAALTDSALRSATQSTSEGLVDARRCVSYLTIEHHGAIDPALWARMGVRLFGCDACQACCPHNRNLPPGDAELVGPNGVATSGLADVLGWSQTDWRQATAGSAVRRVGYEGFLRNAVVAAGNSRDASLVAALGALQLPDPCHAELLRWALDRAANAGDKPFDASAGGGI